MADLEVIEICAGAGGQALGLERAGFEHALAVEFTDRQTCHFRCELGFCVASMCGTLQLPILSIHLGVYRPHVRGKVRAAFWA